MGSTDTHLASLVKVGTRQATGRGVAPERGLRRADDILSLRHGLEALRRAAAAKGVSSGELALACGISRAAAYRVLQTLQTAGYLRATGLPKRPRFQVTQRICALSSGYAAGVRLLEVAMPIMLEWTLESGWPLEFSTLAGDQAIVRYATDHVAPRALARFRAGSKAPAIASATGLVCLAHQAPRRIAGFFATLPSFAGAAPDVRAARREFLASLARIRQDGFAQLNSPRLREATLAVPLWCEGGAVAGLGLRYMRVADGGVMGHAQRLAALHSLRARIRAALTAG
jgi:DNA-binding IclR family transcriptional regulator